MRVHYIVLVAAALAAPAHAQDSTVVVGGAPASSGVTVDMSVLEEMGPLPSVPELMMTPNRREFQPATRLGRSTMPTSQGTDDAGPQPVGVVTLRPPGGAAPRAAQPSRAASQATRSRPAEVVRSTPTTRQAPSAPSLRPPPEAPAAPDVSVPSLAPSAAPLPPPIAVAPSMPATPQQSAAPAPAPTPPPSPAPPASPPPTRSGPELVTPMGPVPPAAPQVPDRSAAPPPPPVQAAPARPAPAAPPTQTAALPPQGSPGQVSLPFSGEDTNLGDGAKRQLDAIATRAGRDESVRLQLLAYASGTGDASSRARRLSLSRALAVRSYLIDKGVRSTRIDVRALGNRVEGGGDPDRVDVIVSGR